MQKLTREETMEIKAGKGHFHWICTNGKNFISKAYKTAAAAGEAMEKHIGRYHSHATQTSVFYCEKGSCKY
ncbi:MAG: hypothetical protein U0K86_06805 [Agathobacter sp.]|nr:hypothetical protein [Agathobacter sp.]